MKNPGKGAVIAAFNIREGDILALPDRPLVSWLVLGEESTNKEVSVFLKAVSDEGKQIEGSGWIKRFPATSKILLHGRDFEFYRGHA